jgi:hypothetical protein
MGARSFVRLSKLDHVTLSQELLSVLERQEARSWPEIVTLDKSWFSRTPDHELIPCLRCSSLIGTGGMKEADIRGTPIAFEGTDATTATPRYVSTAAFRRVHLRRLPPRLLPIDDCPLPGRPRSRSIAQDRDVHPRLPCDDVTSLVGDFTDQIPTTDLFSGFTPSFRGQVPEDSNPSFHNAPGKMVQPLETDVAGEHVLGCFRDPERRGDVAGRSLYPPAIHMRPCGVDDVDGHLPSSWQTRACPVFMSAPARVVGRRRQLHERRDEEEPPPEDAEEFDLNSSGSIDHFQ